MMTMSISSFPSDILSRYACNCMLARGPMKSDGQGPGIPAPLIPKSIFLFLSGRFRRRGLPGRWLLFGFELLLLRLMFLRYLLCLLLVLLFYLLRGRGTGLGLR